MFFGTNAAIVDDDIDNGNNSKTVPLLPSSSKEVDGNIRSERNKIETLQSQLDLVRKGLLLRDELERVRTQRTEANSQHQIECSRVNDRLEFLKAIFETRKKQFKQRSTTILYRNALNVVYDNESEEVGNQQQQRRPSVASSFNSINNDDNDDDSSVLSSSSMGSHNSSRKKNTNKYIPPRYVFEQQSKLLECFHRTEVMRNQWSIVNNQLITMTRDMLATVQFFTGLNKRLDNEVNCLKGMIPDKLKKKKKKLDFCECCFLCHVIKNFILSHTTNAKNKKRKKEEEGTIAKTRSHKHGSNITSVDVAVSLDKPHHYPRVVMV